jgi:hypothetical protein
MPGWWGFGLGAWSGIVGDWRTYEVVDGLGPDRADQVEGQLDGEDDEDDGRHG